MTSLSMAQCAVAEVRLALAATRSPTAGASPSWRWPTTPCAAALVRDDPSVLKPERTPGRTPPREMRGGIRSCPGAGWIRD
ncbi:MAG TPA: hypothetical protein VFZ72_05925 [Jiangellaceae bacterium]